MTVLTKVALSYLKYCSAIETARDEFAKCMEESLRLSKKLVIRNDLYEGQKLIYITKKSYYLCFSTNEKNITIEITKGKKYSEKEIRYLKSNIKRLEGGNKEYPDDVWKEYPISNFQQGLEEFIQTFNSLTKKQLN